MKRPLPRSTLFPYTTLFRSLTWSADTGFETRRYWQLPVATDDGGADLGARSEEHTSELQSHSDLVCRLLLEKKNTKQARCPGPMSAVYDVVSVSTALTLDRM